MPSPLYQHLNTEISLTTKPPPSLSSHEYGYQFPQEEYVASRPLRNLTTTPAPTIQYRKGSNVELERTTERSGLGPLEHGAAKHFQEERLGSFHVGVLGNGQH